MNKTITILAWISIVIGVGITIFFLLGASKEFTIFNDKYIDFPVTGQFGDFIGGVIGTLFTLAGTILIYLTFKQQNTQNIQEGFEKTFFELLNIHRDNIDQLNYLKYQNGSFKTFENREVFRLIFLEFLECFKEVKKFSNSTKVEDYILPKYLTRLKQIIKKSNQQIDLIEMALIDISYNIVFFGLSEEGETILRDKFKRKYNPDFFFHVLKFIKLKPKTENRKRWKKWENLLSYNYQKFREVNREYYYFKSHHSVENLSEEVKQLIYKKDFTKYYGGHQHRLAHYFRHLFQAIKFINYDRNLNDDRKYFYAKTLRAQLSTYEQSLLFINSISSLGMKWELTPEVELISNSESIEACKLITRYNLIKNLQGYHMYGLRYKLYYPNIKYEIEE